ncbi:hypothetical protein OUZ56_007993 [Daphnia magna]|uniref:Uncharacterized protein n=1 Tax=Daphnia magna TaxID=35525 RepID=A0ABR0ABR1_9CRUS|nr:hypothetical protein OUZ56_007993 [Daphnia magna]
MGKEEEEEKKRKKKKKKVGGVVGEELEDPRATTSKREINYKEWHIKKECLKKERRSNKVDRIEFVIQQPTTMRLVVGRTILGNREEGRREFETGILASS